jgi:ketosteroid isomerase-like protein
VKYRFGSIFAIVIISIAVSAQSGSETDLLTAKVKQFLDGASRNDATIHERFWADELIYTGSSGRRVGKTDIMKDVRSAPSPTTGNVIYTAEDIRVQLHADTAVVAFRLVATDKRGESRRVQQYLNTGTFVKRNGDWKVVAWQATRLPKSEAESVKEFATTEENFRRAIVNSEVATLIELADKNFIWAQHTGEQITRDRLAEQLTSRGLGYSKVDARDMAIQVYGDSALVRGVMLGQRVVNAMTGDSDPVEENYTLILINDGGTWKVVSLHTSPMVSR